MSLEISLSEEQQKVHDILIDFYKSKDELVITVGGFAGTGKTTLLGKVCETLLKEDNKFDPRFATYTGKATTVLNSKLKAIGLSSQTIHSLIYSTHVDRLGNYHTTLKSSIGSEDQDAPTILFIDEASMVPEDVHNDLLSFGIKVVYVGDHGQLPPVGSKFNLMVNPQLKLETIHRQALESPIIKLSLIARESGRVCIGEYGPGVYKTSDRNRVLDSLDYKEDHLFLCGRNVTRVGLNKLYRKRLGIKALGPVIGDKIICLKNNKDEGIYNGLTGIVLELKENKRHLEIKAEMSDGNVFTGSCFSAQFNHPETLKTWTSGNEHYTYRTIGNLFDFGRALTVHKAQGSEADSVVVFEERNQYQSDDDWRRWLYTAVTRAKEKLILVGV